MVRLHLTELLATIVLAACVQGILTSRIKRQVIDTGIYQWTQWTHWSSCNATCDKNKGFGKQSRTRKCMDDEDRKKIIHCQEPYIHVDEADDPIKDVQDSHVIIKRDSHFNDPTHYDVQYLTCKANCPRLAVDGGWSHWLAWTKCTTNQSPNIRLRSRLCNSPQPSYGGNDCIGSSSLRETCASNVWSDWSAYTSCSVSCGTGKRTRSRTCTTGNDCVGSNLEETACVQPACVVDGGWGTWSTYSKCSVTCGHGVMYRLRACDSPAPAHRGLNCSGLASEFQVCHAQECPVDGGWSNYTELPCSATCGIGVQTTFRTCTNPAPAHGGTNCTGEAYTFKHCKKVTCPIDGGWSNYTELSCSTTCGLGVQASFRTCTNPAPAHGGKNCTGSTHAFKHCQLGVCPIDGGWGNWSVWSTCSVTSGFGMKIRTRNCTAPAPQNGGKGCVGDYTETDKCVVNQWSVWSSWSACDATCGNATRSRHRSCHTGNDCIGDGRQTIQCNLTVCYTDKAYSQWSNWGDCSVTCGQGISTRTRECHSEFDDTHDCVDEFLEKRECHLAHCPIDGGYGNWSSWSECSTTCGNGSMQRIRQCDSPVPQFGGQNCNGEPFEKQDCKVKECPIDGGWSPYVNQSCSVTCGTGTVVAVRACTNPTPEFGGKTCNGTYNQTYTCAEEPCQIDGAWTMWSDWGSCDKTCGNGTQTRTRSCTNPTSQYGGQNCSGDGIETESCFEVECPIDGGWREFVNQSCSVTCGTGLVLAVRACDNPKPAFGGQPCNGSYYQKYTCEEEPCAIDGAWTTWTDWGSCDNTCGNGTMTRTRSCNNPAPQHGGQICSGDDFETQACFEVECPIDGGWGAYNSLPCSVTCGVGQKIALRECDNPAPRFGGNQCVGTSHQITECQMPACAVDGGWSDWSAVGQCSSMCGNGHLIKTRTCTNPAPAHGGNNCTGATEDRVLCDSGTCPPEIRLCDKVRVHKVLNEDHLYSPIMPPPCSNMDFIPQEAMIKDVCNATDDVIQWTTTKDIRQICDSAPLYSPVTKIHREYNTREYGVLMDCYNHTLKFATETCTTSVHEIVVDLTNDDGWDYFMTTW